jgi:hypothetical protein
LVVLKIISGASQEERRRREKEKISLEKKVKRVRKRNSKTT